MTAIKKNLVKLAVLIFSVFLSLAFAFSFTKGNAVAEELIGFYVSENVQLENDENGDSFLRFEVIVGDDWLSENKSSVYTVGTLIYPTKNGIYDEEKTLSENEEILDSVNIVLKNSEIVSEGFVGRPSILFTIEDLVNWILKVKPELANDEDGLYMALDKVYEHLLTLELSAVSYVITDDNFIVSNTVSATIESVVSGGGGGEEISQEVTEEEFYSALAFDGVDRVAVTTNTYTNSSGQESENYRQVVYDRNKVYDCNSNVYYEKTEDGSFAYSFSGNGWEKIQVEDDQYPSLDSLKTAYASALNYQDFTFIDGVYVSSVSIDGQSAYCGLTFRNKRLVEVCIKQETEGFIGEQTERFEYEIMEIVLPTEGSEGGEEFSQEVTEEEFYLAVVFDGVDRVRRIADTFMRFGESEIANHNEVYYDGNKIYDSYNNNYYEITDDGVYVYTFDPELGWVKNTANDGEYPSLLSIAGLFERVKYSDFTFTDGVYVASVEIDGSKIRCELVFRNKKLSNLYYEEVNEKYSMTQIEHYDYDGMEIFLPSEGDSGNTGIKNWESYFNFSNVTIDITETLNTPGFNYGGTYVPEKTQTDRSKIEIQNPAWLYTAYDYYYEDETLSEFVVHFDGMNAYVFGEVDDSQNFHLGSVLAEIDYCYQSGDFKEISPNVYYAEYATADQLGKSLKQVTITIENGFITSIVTDMTIVYTEGTDIIPAGYTATGRLVYEFSNWYSTTVEGGMVTPDPKPEPDPDPEFSQWFYYFNFNSVTINKEMIGLVDGREEVLDLKAKWKISGDQWSCVQNMESTNGIVTKTDYVYFDGCDFYYNGTLTSDDYTYVIFDIGDLLDACINNETLFTDLGGGEYFAEKVYYFNQVTVVIVNERLYSISYVLENGYSFTDKDGNTEVYPALVTYTFSDFDQTVVTDPYLTFDAFGTTFSLANITATKTDDKGEFSAVWKIEGARWSYEYSYEKEGNGEHIYFNGENYYVDGNLETEVDYSNTLGFLTLLVEAFAENDFEFESNGSSYYCEELSVLSDCYYDISVFVKGDRIVQIIYTEQTGSIGNDEGVTPVYTTYTINFSNWGKTIA